MHIVKRKSSVVSVIIRCHNSHLSHDSFKAFERPLQCPLELGPLSPINSNNMHRRLLTRRVMHNADLSFPHYPHFPLTNLELLLAKSNHDSSLSHGASSVAFDKDRERFIVARGNVEKLECAASRKL
jgi:hypothetical protein